MAAKKAKTPAKAAAKSKTTTKAKAAAKPKTVAKAKTTAKTAAKTKTAAKKTKAPVKTMAKAVKNVKSFDTPKYQEFTIRDNSGVVGQVRLKPTSVAWKPKSAKAYSQISIDQLAALTAEHGRQVKA